MSDGRKRGKKHNDADLKFIFFPSYCMLSDIHGQMSLCAHRFDYICVGLYIKLYLLVASDLVSNGQSVATEHTHALSVQYFTYNAKQQPQ